MSQKIIIESLAMDLKRVALGYHRGSKVMAERFKIEALKRGLELESQQIDDYLKTLLKKSKQALEGNTDKIAEDSLMYSTLFQNYVVKNM